MSGHCLYCATSSTWQMTKMTIFLTAVLPRLLIINRISSTMSQKRTRPPSPLSTGLLFKSSPILDRSSEFVGFYSPTLSAKELQVRPEISSATHRIAAWRKPSSQQALSSQHLFDTNHDDDGEKYGGKTLATVLASMNVEGAVVVARWYGGVMLGPVRFDHIRDSAREAISVWLQETGRASKRLRVQEEIKSKDQLARTLQERDQSITVLRGLLAEKTNSSIPDPPSLNIPVKVPQYSNLPLPTLEKLEQVRDATIGWILNQIEKAEVAQQDASSKADAAIAIPDPVLPESFKRDIVPVSKELGSADFKDDEQPWKLPHSPRPVPKGTEESKNSSGIC